MKSLTVSEALGPRFCLGAVMVQMTGFAASSARYVYLCALGCVISLLPVCKKGIQGSGEGSSGTITKSRSLVTNTHLDIFIADIYDHISIRPFPNQLLY